MIMRWAITILTALMLAILSRWSDAFASETNESSLDLAQAIDLFEQATRAIRTYDLSLHVTRRGLASAVVVDLKKLASGEEARIVEYRPPGANEKPPIRTSRWRQVRDARGRRRVERVGGSGNVESVLVFDGEVTRTLSEPTNRGYLGPPSARYVAPDEDYAGYYATVMSSNTTFVRILRERRGTRLIREDSGRVILDTPPEQGSGYASFGFAISLDAQHGMLPSMIDVRRQEANGEIVSWQKIQVREFLQIPEGWAPKRVIMTYFAPTGRLKGSPTQEVVAEVDMATSSWNRPLSESLFTLAFPQGISVLDDLRRVQFVTGNPRLEANLDELAKHAKKVISNPLPVAEVTPQTNWPLILVVAVNLLILLAIGAVLWRRRVLARTS